VTIATSAVNPRDAVSDGNRFNLEHLSEKLTFAPQARGAHGRRLSLATRKSRRQPQRRLPETRHYTYHVRMDELELDPAGACTCFKLRSLARRVTSLYDEVLAGAGITVTQYAVLTVLVAARRARETIGVTELARRLQADRTTLKRGLDLLLDGGLIAIERQAGQRDARVKTVVVTPAGERRWRAAAPLWRKAQAALDRHLGALLHEGLRKHLDRSLEAIGA
jgi:DNA-binding MarR family transcriptional regulator